MAGLQLDTSINLPGPWLISKEQLEALDKIVADAYGKLVNFHETQIAAETEQRFNQLLANHRDRMREERILKQRIQSIHRNASPPIEEAQENEGKKTRSEPKRIHSKLRAEAETRARSSHSYKKRTRQVTIGLDGGKKLRGESFDEIFKQLLAETPTPIKIDIKIEAGDVTCTLEIRPSSDLELRVYPENAPLAAEVFTNFRDWAASVQPNRWLRLWRKFNGAQWGATPIAILIYLALTQPRRTTSPYITEAHELLRSGITPNNEARAIEILLALSSNYTTEAPLQTTPPSAKLALVALVLFFAIAIMLHFNPPNLVIGVGNGEASLRRWHAWVKFVSKTVPVLIGAQFLIPLARQFFTSWLTK